MNAWQEFPFAALHASAPKDHKCADCFMDKEPCPVCYAVWWKKRHPNTMQVESTRPEALPIYYAHPQQLPQRGEAVNLARNWLDAQGPNSTFHITNKGVRQLAEAVMLMDAWILEVTKTVPSPQEPKNG